MSIRTIDRTELDNNAQSLADFINQNATYARLYIELQDGTPIKSACIVAEKLTDGSEVLTLVLV
jgi:hypothetical protein